MAALDHARVVEILAAYHETLTDRELDDVLPLLVQGLTNQEIADELVVSVGTVQRHVDHIAGKLGAHSRAKAVYTALVLGLVLLGDEDARTALKNLRLSLANTLNTYLGRTDVPPPHASTDGGAR